MNPPDTSSAPGPGGPVRILLVEDDLDQAHLVKFLLEAGGDYTVTLAQDGDRALTLLQEDKWHLVITDLNLPGAHGTAVVESAREMSSSLPIMATTGYTGPEYSQRASELGADAVLVKPLDRDDLLAEVRRLLTTPRQPRAAAPRAPSVPPAEAPSPPAEEPARPSAARPSSSPPKSSPPAQPLQVLAISVRPGDVEAGCGATLLRHRARGDRVVVLHLSSGEPDESGRRRREAAREAGQRLGVRTFVGNAGSAAGDVEAELVRLAGGAVREIRPDILYIPSAAHDGPALRAAHSAALDAARSRVATILAYDAGDVRPEFTPGWFSPLDDELMKTKLEALDRYDPSDVPLHAPARLRSHAEFWGRYAGYRPAEPFELCLGDPPLADRHAPSTTPDPE